MATTTLDMAERSQRRSSSRRAWTLRGMALAASLLCVALAALLGELAARACLPHVNYQDTAARMLAHMPGVGLVWRPGSTGICFGETVRIDASGYRDLEMKIKAADAWLVLGDSVAFGVGVPAAETFVGRVQRELPHVRFLNTSVVGMNLDGQLAAAREMLAREPSIRRVTLFYCLNDLDGVATGSAEPAVWDTSAIEEVSCEDASLGERARRLLRSHSKLYLWAKGTLADRSQTFFRHDAAFYRPGETSRLDGLNRLVAIAELARERGVVFDVVILPYEFQLRAAQLEQNYDVWQPQRQVAGYLAAHGIAHVDARDWFAGEPDGSRHWYLFGDPMHLSSEGHRAVAEHWLRWMQTGAAEEHITARPVINDETERR